MPKGLDLQLRRGFPADLRHLCQTALPGQDHPAGTQIIPCLSTFVVGNRLLGGNVPLAVGGIFPRQGKSTQVRQNQGIYAGIIQPFQVGRQMHHFMVPGHGIHRHMNPDPMAVGKRHRLGQFLRGKIPGKGTHTKVRPRQIHRIRAIEDRHPQPLHISSGT